MNAVSPEPAQTYLQLRSRILNLNPSEVGLAPSNSAPHVWAVLMETGYPVGTASLFSLADGTTSLYYSTGGGMLGSGEFTPVSEASKALVAQAENHLQHMTPTHEFPLPDVGQVRFIIFTYTETFSASASEKAIASRKHPLSPLYTYAQETLTQLRLLAQKKRK